MEAPVVMRMASPLGSLHPDAATRYSPLLRVGRRACRLVIPSVKLRVFYLALLVAVHLSMTDNVQAQAARAAPPPSPSTAVLPGPPSADVLLGPVDWIFLIDTSGSMAGLERGTANIFPQVQEVLRGFVRALRDGDTLTVYVFDTGSSLKLDRREIQGPHARERAIEELNRLEARGAKTHTGAALKDGLKRAAELAERPPGRPAAIILFTDGREDVRGIPNPIRIPDVIRLIPDRNVPYVFYVSLGTQPDQALLGFLKEINKKAQGHGESFLDPKAQKLPEVAKTIRQHIPRERFQVAPPQLDFGELPPGGSATKLVTLISPVQLSVSMQTFGVPRAIEVVSKPARVELPERAGQPVEVTVRALPSATPGELSFRLHIHPELPPEHRGPPLVEIPVGLRISPPPPQPLTVDPRILDLGRIRPGGQGGLYTISISSPVPARLRVTRLNVPPGYRIEGLPEALDVGPTQRQPLVFSVRLPEEAREGLERFGLRLEPLAPPLMLSPEPLIVPLVVRVAWTWWERVVYAVGAAVGAGLTWVARYWLWGLLVLLVLVVAWYFGWRWYVYDELPWETPVVQAILRLFRRPAPRSPAVLSGPGVRIPLDHDEVRIGVGGAYLSDSLAAFIVRRAGNDHRMVVQQGELALAHGYGAERSTLREDNEPRLRHGDWLFVPRVGGQEDYELMYRNSSQAGRQ